MRIDLIGSDVAVVTGTFRGWLGKIANVVYSKTGTHFDVRFFDQEETLSFRLHELRLVVMRPTLVRFEATP